MILPNLAGIPDLPCAARQALRVVRRSSYTRSHQLARRRGLSLVFLGVMCLSSFFTLGAGPPGLQGSAPGSLTLYPEQITAQQEAKILPQLSAPAAILAGGDGGQPLAGKNVHERLAMSVIITVVLYILFTMALDVMLPRGVGPLRDFALMLETI